MTDCPPKLRGDLSKWLCEISTGVYVGQVSSRVREAIWERVCKNLRTGRAVMVWSANNEQHMDFCVHNTVWEPVDFDGIKLMRRPLPQNAIGDTVLKPGFSNAAKRQMAGRPRPSHTKTTENYVVIDVETTGLDSATDQIIEYGAVRVVNGQAEQTFSALVKIKTPLPKEIVKLTGITDALLQAEGQSPEQALAGFLNFIGKEHLIGQNITFDLAFLNAACRQNGCAMITNRCTDLLSVARRKVAGVPDHKLATLAKYFSLPIVPEHRALNDCRLAQAVYQKLKEF